MTPEIPAELRVDRVASITVSEFEDVFGLEDSGTVDIGAVGASSVANAQKRLEHVRAMTVTEHLGLDEDEQTLTLALAAALDARLEQFTSTSRTWSCCLGCLARTSRHTCLRRVLNEPDCEREVRDCACGGVDVVSIFSLVQKKCGSRSAPVIGDICDLEQRMDQTVRRLNINDTTSNKVYIFSLVQKKCGSSSR